jgi:hypothetical protein
MQPDAAGANISQRRPVVLWAVWALSFGLALLFATIFFYGVLRDTRAGEPTVTLNLGATSDWQSLPFRVWSSGTYRLFISTTNHDPALVGVPFAGAFDVMLVRPSGEVALQRSFSGAAIHRVPDNYGDTLLDAIQLESAWLRPWLLKVRVSTADESFGSANSQLKLWKARVDAGMGGLVNYVMAIPAAVFLLIAFFVGVSLAARGRPAPLILTSAVTALTFLVVVA